MTDDLFNTRVTNALDRFSHFATPPNPVVSFKVTPNVATWGATADFALGASVAGINSIRLMRNSINDLSSAIVLQTWPLSAEDANRDFKYQDLDKTLLANSFYWVESIPVAGYGGIQQSQNIPPNPIVSGPVNLNALSSSLLAPDAITDFSVALSGDKGGYQVVYVNFNRPTDPTFGSCQIDATGYEADPQSQGVGQSLFSPFSYNMNKTGETIVLSAFAISQNGIPATSAPSVTVTLNGTETVPGKLMNVFVTPIIGGVQVDFDAGLEPDVTSFKISRGAHGAGFGAATLLTTITSTGARHYTSLDAGGLVTPGFDYFVQAVNPVGTSVASQAASGLLPPQNMDQIGQGSTYMKVPTFSGNQIVVPNANFEASSTLPPPGWETVTNATLSYETASPSSGLQTLKVTSTAANGGVGTPQKFPVVVADSYYVQANMKGDGTASAARTSLRFFTSTGTSVGQIDALGGSPTAASYNVYNNSGVVPATATYCQVFCENYGTSGTTAWFDDIQILRKSSMDNNLVDGPIFRRLKFVSSANTMDVSSALNAQGSIVPGQALLVTVTLAPTTLTISWSAQTVLRADGSTISVPASGASPIVYSGLSNSTSYTFYLYVLVSTGVITSASANPPSTTPNAVTAAQAAADGRFALTPITATTQSGGGTGGSGGGGAGGGGSCPEGQELVEIERFEGNDFTKEVIFSGLCRAIDVVAGDFIKGYSFKEKKDVYRQVICTRHEEIVAWRMLDGYRVSPCEPIWYDNAWVPAFKVPSSTFDDSLGVRCDITVSSDDYNESNYYLVGSKPLLIHNGFVLPC